MSKLFVRDLEPNKTITSSFLVQNKEIRQKKTGEPFLCLVLSDRTGEVDARMWDNASEVMDAFDRDDFVQVKGLVQIFHNRPQVVLHKLRRMDESEVQFVEYFPASERDPEEMWRELRALVAGMENAHLRGLLDAILDDPEVAAKYRIAPAAKQIHHAFLGGLIEHVLSMSAMARLAASHYKEIDLDLLLTGVVLHDIGKVWELTYERGFGYSTEGQLLGHMAIAVKLIAEKLPAGFPRDLRMLVEHMVLSHHGQLEFGSPKVPVFPEALLLHYLDDLDSKLEVMRASVAKDRLSESLFTPFVGSMERSVLKKARYLSGEPAAKLDPAPATPAPAPAEAPKQHPAFAPKGPGLLGEKLAAALGQAKER